MANRNLTPDELERANELLAEIRERLAALSAGDSLLLFAYRRKVVKELGYQPIVATYAGPRLWLHSENSI